MSRTEAAQLATELRGLAGPGCVLPTWLQRALDGEHDRIDVLEPNWDAVKVFRLCRAQVSFGGWAGFPSSEIQIVAQTLSIELTEDLLSRVRVMEGEAARIYSARAERARKQQRTR